MRALWVLVLVTSLGVGAAARQQAPAAPAAQPKVTIDVGEAAAPPEWELRVPLTLTLAPGTEVARVTMTMSYPAQVLHYQSLEKPDALKTVDLELEARPAKGTADAETASLQIEVRTTPAKPAPLPAGLLANVIFKVDTTAEPREWPVTVQEVKAWGTGSAAAAVEAGPGRTAAVTVAPAGLPIFACFFYMH